jgi:hypothetical protein
MIGSLAPGGRIIGRDEEWLVRQVDLSPSGAHLLTVTELKPLAPGLTPRGVLDKFAAMQMLDVHFPTTDARELIFRRYTQPEKDQKMLLAQLNWELPPQSPPRLTQKGQLAEE